MPKGRHIYSVPSWRKPICFGNFDETCETNLQEGCQWITECKIQTNKPKTTVSQK